jgi:hypothetical protein
MVFGRFQQFQDTDASRLTLQKGQKSVTIKDIFGGF